PRRLAGAARPDADDDAVAWLPLEDPVGLGCGASTLGARDDVHTFGGTVVVGRTIHAFRLTLPDPRHAPPSGARCSGTMTGSRSGIRSVSIPSPHTGHATRTTPSLLRVVPRVAASIEPSGEPVAQTNPEHVPPSAPYVGVVRCR